MKYMSGERMNEFYLIVFLLLIFSRLVFRGEGEPVGCIHGFDRKLSTLVVFDG